MKPTRPVVRYHGGKWRLAPWILSHFPAHRVYVEPFGGGGSILMQKPPAPVEIYNDKFDRVVNVFKVLRDPARSKQLEQALTLTPYSETEYRACREIHPDPVEDARRLIVLGHQGHGSTAPSGGRLSGWRRGVRANACGSSAIEWQKLWHHVSRWTDRFRGVYIECDEATAVMKRWDGPTTLHYVDPPYVACTRTRGLSSYAHEMADADHRRLAETLEQLRGMVILSGYHSPLYDNLFAKWDRIERTHMADKGQRRTEVLWFRNTAPTPPPP